MKIVFKTMVPVQVLPLGDFRSLPAEVGASGPVVPVRPLRPLEFPQTMTASADVVIPPMEPANDSILALTGLPRSIVVPAELEAEA